MISLYNKIKCYLINRSNLSLIKKLNYDRTAKYSISKSGLIDVEGHVILSELRLKKIPVSFGVVTGNFDCSYNNLTSLKGSPIRVHGSFNCSHNKLNSLKGSPICVRGSFLCDNNILTSLHNSPTEVGYDFTCSHNQLTTLEGLPNKIGSSIDFFDNPKLIHVGHLLKCELGGTLFGNISLINELYKIKKIEIDF